MSCGSGVGADPELHCLLNAPYCDLDDQAAVSPGFVAMTSLWYKKDERESKLLLLSTLLFSLSLSRWLWLTPIASVHSFCGVLQRLLGWGFGTERPE